MKFSTIRGTRDIFGRNAECMRFIESKAQHVFTLFNYKEIRTPIFEETGLFTRSIGEATDIVEKEMYSFKDKKGRNLTLRPEGTAPVVRAYLQANLNRTEKITRLFYKGQMFRYERPQAGRHREFWQIGAEFFGSDSYVSDTEIILLNALILKKCGIDNLTLHINSIGCDNCRDTYKQALIAFAVSLKSTLCDNCNRRIQTNPLRILDCKKPDCKQQLKNAPKTVDFLDDNCRRYLNNVIASLKHCGINDKTLMIDSSIVRGLDYYTGVVFEFKSNKLGAQDALSAGGRYDALVHELGGPHIPAVGFAMGIDRIITLLSERVQKKDNDKNIFIAVLNNKAADTALSIAQQLRSQDIPAEIEIQNRSLKNQLSYAADKGFSHVIILGEDELKQGTFTLKNLADKTQISVPTMDTLLQTLKTS